MTVEFTAGMAPGPDVLLLVFGTLVHVWYVLACGFALAAFAGLNNLAPGDAARALGRRRAGAVGRVPAAVRAAVAAHAALRAAAGQGRAGLLAALALTALYAAVDLRLASTLRAVQALVVASTVLLAAGALLAWRAHAVDGRRCSARARCCCWPASRSRTCRPGASSRARPGN
jgi:hypothetical protein